MSIKKGKTPESVNPEISSRMPAKPSCRRLGSSLFSLPFMESLGLGLGLDPVLWESVSSTM
eukprot:4475326-Amphidinium_carterae.1